jgi:hypothetical protein
MTLYQGLTFVNTTAPQEATSEGNRKKVRTAAAKAGWALDFRSNGPEVSVIPVNLQSPYPARLGASFNGMEESKKSFDTDASEGFRTFDTSTSRVFLDADSCNTKMIGDTKALQRSLVTKYRGTELLDTHTIGSNSKRKQGPCSTLSSSISRQVPMSLALASSSASLFRSTGVGFVDLYDLGSGVRDVFNCYSVNSKPWHDRVLHHSKK